MRSRRKCCLIANEWLLRPRQQRPPEASRTTRTRPARSADADDAAEESNPSTSREGDVPWKPQSSVLRSTTIRCRHNGAAPAGSDDRNRELTTQNGGKRSASRRTSRAAIGSRHRPHPAQRRVTEGEEGIRRRSTEGDSQEEDSPSAGERPGKTAETDPPNRGGPRFDVAARRTTRRFTATARSCLPSDDGDHGTEFDRRTIQQRYRNRSVRQPAHHGDHRPGGLPAAIGSADHRLPPLPTTGIGAGPLNSTIPSGIPSPFVPLASLPRASVSRAPCRRSTSPKGSRRRSAPDCPRMARTTVRCSRRR